MFGMNFGGMFGGEGNNEDKIKKAAAAAAFVAATGAVNPVEAQMLPEQCEAGYSSSQEVNGFGGPDENGFLKKQGYDVSSPGDIKATITPEDMKDSTYSSVQGTGNEADVDKTKTSVDEGNK